MATVPEDVRVDSHDVCRFAVYGKPVLQSAPDAPADFSAGQRLALMQFMRAAISVRLMEEYAGQRPDHPLVDMFAIPVVQPAESRELLRELLFSPLNASCMLQRDKDRLQLVLRVFAHCAHGKLGIDCLYPLAEKSQRLTALNEPAFKLLQPPGCLFVDGQGLIVPLYTLTRRMPRIYRLRYDWVFQAFVLPFCDFHQNLMANQWFRLQISLSQQTVTLGPGNDNIH